MTANENCYFYDYGKTAPKEYGIYCNKKKINIKDAGCEECEMKGKELFYSYKLLKPIFTSKESLYHFLDGLIMKAVISVDEDVTIFALQDLSSNKVYVIDVTVK